MGLSAGGRGLTVRSLLPWRWLASCYWPQKRNRPKPWGPSHRPTDPIAGLAPGVMKSVDPRSREAETFSRHDVVELLAVDPDLDWAKGRPVPPRHLALGVQVQADADDLGRRPAAGRADAAEVDLVHGLQRDQPGQGRCIRSKDADEHVSGRRTSDKPIRFVPEFLLGRATSSARCIRTA